MTAVCPSCGCEQGAGLLCADETAKLERLLAEVPALVAELQTTISKQARIGSGGGSGGLAREKSPVHFGAIDVADNLAGTLTIWSREMAGDDFRPVFLPNRTTRAAAFLFARINEVRRHPQVADILDEITDAIGQARKVIDRPADRVYLGTCLVPSNAPGTNADGSQATECQAEVWARQNATQADCRTCGITHDVAERRAWLLLQAADLLFTARDASRLIGRVGNIDVTESSIRGLIHRKRFAYRPGTTIFRLGDLLDVLTDMRAKEAAA